MRMNEKDCYKFREWPMFFFPISSFNLLYGTHSRGAAQLSVELKLTIS